MRRQLSSHFCPGKVPLCAYCSVHVISFLPRHPAGIYPLECPFCRYIGALWVLGHSTFPVSDVPWHMYTSAATSYITFCDLHNFPRTHSGKTMFLYHVYVTPHQTNFCEIIPIGHLCQTWTILPWYLFHLLLQAHQSYSCWLHQIVWFPSQKEIGPHQKWPTHDHLIHTTLCYSQWSLIQRHHACWLAWPPQARQACQPQHSQPLRLPQIHQSSVCKIPHYAMPTCIAIPPNAQGRLFFRRIHSDLWKALLYPWPCPFL